MKATFSQVEVGLMSYIDKELAGQADGLKKLLVVGVEVLAAGKLESIVAPLMNKDIVKTLGVVDEQGMIELDVLRDAMLKAIDKLGSVTQDIPFLGKVTFKREDIDQLYNLIRSA